MLRCNTTYFWNFEPFLRPLFQKAAQSFRFSAKNINFWEEKAILTPKKLYKVSIKILQIIILVTFFNAIFTRYIGRQIVLNISLATTLLWVFISIFVELYKYVRKRNLSRMSYSDRANYFKDELVSDFKISEDVALTIINGIDFSISDADDIQSCIDAKIKERWAERFYEIFCVANNYLRENPNVKLVLQLKNDKLYLTPSFNRDMIIDSFPKDIFINKDVRTFNKRYKELLKRSNG